jgi:hypothetical protein
MIRQQLLEPHVGNLRLKVRRRQRLHFRLGQTLEGLPELGLQRIKGLFRNQADHGQIQRHAVRLELREEARGAPVLTSPSALDLVEARPCSLAPADHLEHLLQGLVPALADAVTTPAAQLLQQVPRLHRQPRVARLAGGKALPVLRDRGRIEILEAEALQDTLVGRHWVGVREHSAKLVVGAPVISFVLAAEGVPKRCRR